MGGADNAATNPELPTTLSGLII